jgi:uncharacterized membrane protein
MSGLVSKNMRRLVRFFLAGILAILPVMITVAIVAWVTGFVRQILGPGTLIGKGLTHLGLRFVTNDTVAYLVGGLLVLGCVLLLGVAVEEGAKNLLQHLLDLAMRRIPIISNIYGTSKQLVNLFEKKEPGQLQGMKAVFCFFGEKTGAGLLALLVSSEEYCINGRNFCIVIVPTAPVPVGGGLFFIPVEMIQPTEVSVEALMSIYVSMGVTAPQFLGTSTKSK